MVKNGKLLIVLIILFQIQCISFNSQERNKSITELKILKSYEFEIMKKFGSKYYVSAFYGNEKDILDLISVRNNRLVGKLDLYKFWDLKYCPYGHR